MSMIATAPIALAAPALPTPRLLDLDRYPVHMPDSPAWNALVASCREQLRACGACELPGFLTPDATAAMAKEADDLATQQYHSTVYGNAYLEPIDETLPPEHVKRLTDVTSLGVVAYDQFPQHNLLKQLYEWDPLMDFLAAALGKPRLYRYGDPMGALNLSVMGEDDYLRWHFDQTDFVVSIALQSPKYGGEFEFVPYIRTPTEERWERVHALLKGERQGVQTIPMVPGTLLLFEGRYSIHRVTQIKGQTLRHVALLGYDTRPGIVSTEHLQKIRYGRTSHTVPATTPE